MRGLLLSCALGFAAALVTVAMALTFEVTLLSAVSAAIGAGIPVATIFGIIVYENRGASGTRVESS